MRKIFRGQYKKGFHQESPGIFPIDKIKFYLPYLPDVDKSPHDDV